MKYTRFVEKVRYEKIRSRKKAEKHFPENEYETLAGSLTPAGIHAVEDRLVLFDEKRRESYKEGGRPGVITREPNYHSRWQARWVPFSTRMKHRNDDRVVYLSRFTDHVAEDCVALPFFSQSFHCKTFSRRTGKLPDEKFNAIVLLERGVISDEF